MPLEEAGGSGAMVSSASGFLYMYPVCALVGCPSKGSNLAESSQEVAVWNGTCYLSDIISGLQPELDTCDGTYFGTKIGQNRLYATILS